MKQRKNKNQMQNRLIPNGTTNQMGKKIVYENQATAQLRLRLRQRRSSDANDTATM